MSHSPWVRGLKLLLSWLFLKNNSVALPVSAWIEIFSICDTNWPLSGRTPRECVDWNCYTVVLLISTVCRTPRECVDWNFLAPLNKAKEIGRTPRECVDWNIQNRYKLLRIQTRRTPRECVDWNFSFGCYDWTIFCVALPVSAWIEIDLCPQRQNLPQRRTPRECVDWNPLPSLP